MAHAVAVRSLRAAAGAILAAATAAAAAETSIHSGHLPTILGIGERVVCIVTNVGKKPIDTVRVRIRNAEFGTTSSDVTCNGVAPGAACPAEFPANGPAFIVHFACSADVTAKDDELRGTFYRTSSAGTSGDLAIELR